MDMSLILLLTMGFLASAVIIGFTQAIALVVARRRTKR